MGCECKGNLPNKNISEVKENELNLKGQLLKIPMAIGLTLLFIILSPILVIYVWYLAIMSIFNQDTTILKDLLHRFRKVNPSEDYLSEEIIDSEYEIDGLEIIE
tara:strand:- start:259 stop:570 length:312 start_codon:yes stop_codon:yes gene_type:complete